MALDSPGFFGKVPARGDFIGRRVPAGLAASWDDWLGQLTLAARDAAGTAWPEAWLTAPLWHFTLGQTIAPPFGAAGTLVASADRVGRFFPFSIIGPARGIPDQAWSAAIEALILDSLDDDFTPDRLDAALDRLGPPPDSPALAPDQSLWWSRGSDRVEPTRQVIIGLPPRQMAAAMMMGQAPDPQPV
jgi:type VI secretion system protein ImpM